MTIYEELVKGVEEGKNFYVNFSKRRMKVGHKVLVDKGEWNNKKDLGVEHLSLEECLTEIEELFADYKYSVPSGRSEMKYKKYFKALTMEELPQESILNVGSRDIAQAKLEGFILCHILNGTLYWESEDKWFWKSQKYPELVILKEWITGGNKNGK